MVLVALAAGCGGATEPIPEATPAMAEALGVETAQLVRGRALYMKHCAGCHDRVTPGAMEPEYWRGIMPHMAEHAKLDPESEKELLLYVMAAHGTVHGADLEH